MLLRKSALIPALLTVAPASAYFAQVSNAHVEFAATGSIGQDGSSAAETVDDRSSLQHATQSLWSSLEDALEKKSELGFAAPKIMELFEDWVGRFAKEYETAEEKGRRMLVWLENHVLIETHNAKKASFTLGHNEYSDMTHDEFLQRMKLGPYSPGLIIGDKKEFNFMEFHEHKKEDVSNSRLRGTEEAAVERKLQAATSDADEKDWHGIGLMGPIRNQGICGACWAFSAIGAIESAMAIGKFKKMTPNEQSALVEQKSKGEVSVGNDLGLVVPLSEQNLIDCDTMMEKGCDGGLMTTTFDEEEAKKGICSEIDYPYIQSQGTCASNLCTPVPDTIVKDHVDIMPQKTNALKEALKVQPVTAAMVATDPMFQFYKNGIYQQPDCGKVTKAIGDADCQVLYQGQVGCLPDINHGVLVVGYGDDETATTDIKKFFKVKNSWGSAWGEGGYFRLARWEEDKTDPATSWGECAILTLLSYPVLA